MKVNLIKCGISSVIGSLAVLLGSGSCALGKNCSVEPITPNDKSSYKSSYAASSAPLTISSNSQQPSFKLEAPSIPAPQTSSFKENLSDINQIDSNLKSQGQSENIAKNINIIDNSNLVFKLNVLAFIILSLWAVFSLKKGYDLILSSKAQQFFKERVSLEVSQALSRFNNFLIILENIVYSKIKALYHSAQNIGAAFIYQATFSHTS